MPGITRPTEDAALSRLRHYKPATASGGRLNQPGKQLHRYVVCVNGATRAFDVMPCHETSKEGADQRVKTIGHVPGDVLYTIPGLSREHVEATAQVWLSEYGKILSTKSGAEALPNA